MEITGKLIAVLPLVTGQGKNGEWRKQEFVIEHGEGNFPKKACISLWGDKIESAALKEGQQVTVQFDIESREYNGRYFTECKAWKVEYKPVDSAQPAPGSPDPPMPGNPADTPF